MKILVVIFWFTSIKSTLGMSDHASPQRLNYSRRRLLLPNQYQRVNPDVAKLIFLKNLLELDSLRNIYFQNCQIAQQFPNSQKLPSSTRYNGMPAFRNGGIHPMTSNGVKRKYFINPKIIILPPLPSTQETVADNFQNYRELNYKKQSPQYFRTVSGDGKKTKAAEGKKEESFRNENLGGNFPSASAANAKNPVTKNSRPQRPINSPTDGYPKTTPNLHDLIKSSPTQIYEVEEIIEGTMNVDEENLKKMGLGERTYFENNMGSISSENQEKKILGNSIMKIIKGMTDLVTNQPPLENNLGEAGSSSKASFVQTTAPAHLQHLFRVPPSDEANKRTTIPTVKESPSRGITQNSDLLSIKKPDNEQGVLNSVNKFHKIFEATPSVTTSHFKHAISEKEKAQKSEARRYESAPNPFFGFFNKESSDSTGQNPEATPKNISVNSFGLPQRSFGNISDEDLQHLLRNLKLKDDTGMIKNEPQSSTTQTFSQTVTISVQIDNATLIPFPRTLSTPSTSESDKNIPAEVRATTLRIAESRKGTPGTTSNSNGLNSDLTTSTFEELSDGPLTIDLLSSTTKPELKKDQESSGKNSRKMHFNQDTQKGTFNEITESFDAYPRRSDILITDYTDDYKDNETRFSSPSYLERIKANDTISTEDFLSSIKVDSYVPLIPEIINDIREDKISPQDLSLLSRVFGKYWSSILAMSNNTELDVLPLLTMKNENDLITVLESRFSNEAKTSTTEIDETNTDEKDFSRQTYDYGNAYEDLYDYVLGQEIREKRKRYRHKRDEELEYQKLEANKEYFESLEEEQRNGKIEYMVEYAMYDESLEDESLSVLELIKPADLYVNIKNETSREEPH